MDFTCLVGRLRDWISAAHFQVSDVDFFEVNTSYLSISSEPIKHSCALLTMYFFYHFSSSHSAFYKVLISNAATSALRLHQRLPHIQFTKEFLALLLIEDSCHYLFFSLIFLYVQPFILIIVPVLLFAVLHSASYSLKLLDVSRDIAMQSSRAIR